MYCSLCSAANITSSSSSNSSQSRVKATRRCPISRDQPGLLMPLFGSLQTQIEFHPAICTAHTQQRISHQPWDATLASSQPRGCGASAHGPQAFRWYSLSRFVCHWREFPCFDVGKRTERHAFLGIPWALHPIMHWHGTLRDTIRMPYSRPISWL